MKQQRIEAVKAELKQQRLQAGTQGRPSMLRRFVKSVTPNQGPSLEAKIKSLTGEVSGNVQSQMWPAPACYGQQMLAIREAELGGILSYTTAGACMSKLVQTEVLKVSAARAESMWLDVLCILG